MTHPPADGTPSAPATGNRFHRWRDRVRGHAVGGPVYRGGVLVVGVTIAVAGIAMLALPGPGWAAIFIGLAVLASEFAFAQRLRDRAMHRVRSARSRAQDPEWRRRYRTRIAVLVVAVVLVVAALVWWWVGRYGWTLRPVISLP